MELTANVNRVVWIGDTVARRASLGKTYNKLRKRFGSWILQQRFVRAPDGKSDNWKWARFDRKNRSIPFLCKATFCTESSQRKALFVRGFWNPSHNMLRENVSWSPNSNFGPSGGRTLQSRVPSILDSMEGRILDERKDGRKEKKGERKGTEQVYRCVLWWSSCTFVWSFAARDVQASNTVHVAMCPSQSQIQGILVAIQAIHQSSK